MPAILYTKIRRQDRKQKSFFYHPPETTHFFSYCLLWGRLGASKGVFVNSGSGVHGNLIDPNLLEPLHHFPVPLHLLEKHLLGPDPHLPVSIEGLVNNLFLLGFTVLGDTDETVVAAFEMTIVFMHGVKVIIILDSPP